MKDINKKIKFLDMVRFVSFPLGWGMIFFTYNAFGNVISTVLGIIATISFWMIISKEKSDIIGKALTDEALTAIDKVGHIESLFETKNMRYGMLFRVYLIKAGEKSEIYNKAIVNALLKCEIFKRVWVIQVSDMNSTAEFRDRQLELNESLLEQIKSKRNR